MKQNEFHQLLAIGYRPSARLRHALSLLVSVAILALPHRAFSQAVAVTMSLDNTNLAIGQFTTLHIYAQVVPTLRTNSAQIFSWYVDVLNTNGAVASADYAAMQKPASDKDPLISSNGVSQGANRRGIYDTFLNLPGAGVSNRVELLSIPITALANGQTRFSVQAGSGVPLMSSDFQVAPADGGVPFTGGDYSIAWAELSVGNSAPCNIELQVSPLSGGGGPGGTFQLNFTPCPGHTHTVEFRNVLGDVNGWQPLPGAPHNSGSVVVTNSTTSRFFRVRIDTP